MYLAKHRHIKIETTQTRQYLAISDTVRFEPQVGDVPEWAVNQDFEVVHVRRDQSEFISIDRHTGNIVKVSSGCIDFISSSDYIDDQIDTVDLSAKDYTAKVRDPVSGEYYPVDIIDGSTYKLGYLRIKTVGKPVIEVMPIEIGSELELEPLYCGPSKSGKVVYRRYSIDHTDVSEYANAMIVVEVEDQNGVMSLVGSISKDSDRVWLSDPHNPTGTSIWYIQIMKE